MSIKLQFDYPTLAALRQWLVVDLIENNRCSASSEEKSLAVLVNDGAGQETGSTSKNRSHKMDKTIKRYDC